MAAFWRFWMMLGFGVLTIHKNHCTSMWNSPHFKRGCLVLENIVGGGEGWVDWSLEVGVLVLLLLCPKELRWAETYRCLLSSGVVAGWGNSSHQTIKIKGFTSPKSFKWKRAVDGGKCLWSITQCYTLEQVSFDRKTTYCLPVLHNENLLAWIDFPEVCHFTL